MIPLPDALLTAALGMMDGVEREVAQWWQRLGPHEIVDAGWWVGLGTGLALVCVGLPWLWLRARLLVTLTHEAGHAVVGMLGGRRFSGFVVNADMSGHAVTSGKPRGLAIIASTWAGYPAPGLLGAAWVACALAGWGRPLLVLTTLILLLGLVWCRSWGTAGLVLLAALGAGALAWWGSAHLLLAVGVCLGLFLLLGAWRHLLAVMAGGGRGDDPAVLARLTHLPAWFWVGSYVLALAACTWWAAHALWPALHSALRG